MKTANHVTDDFFTARIDHKCRATGKILTSSEVKANLEFLTSIRSLKTPSLKNEVWIDLRGHLWKTTPAMEPTQKTRAQQAMKAI